jgi:maleylacetoacetate isomerase
MITLYTYFRSSAAFRLRLALNVKGLPWTPHYVSLLKAEHRDEAYLKLNPQGLVPVLLDGQQRLNQSMAVIEYLDETQSGPKLLPTTALGRYRARQLSQVIACDLHPINNLRILKYLKGSLKQEQEAIDTWYRHWCVVGLTAFEKELHDAPEGLAAGTYCIGDTVSMADICLVPQVFNAQRFAVDMTAFPKTLAIFEQLMKLPAFDQAQPSKQPDAV